MAKKLSINKKYLGVQIGTPGHPLPKIITIKEGMHQRELNWLALVEHPAIIVEEIADKKAKK